MKSWKRTAIAVVCAIGIVSMIGCSDEVDDLVNGPVEEAVEAGIDDALTTTVVPLVTFMGTVGELLTAPVANATRGQACPDTTGWCSSGSVICSVSGNGYLFDFDQCQVVAGDEPMTLDGGVGAVPGNPIFLTFNGLFINDSPAINGSGTINTSTCDYTVNVNTSDATITGTVTKCDSAEYPTGDVVQISFGDFLVTVVLNGTNTAPAQATEGGSLVATCSINLDTLVSTCAAD